MGSLFDLTGAYAFINSSSPLKNSSSSPTISDNSKGTRFQAAGNPDEEKDVVTEHENKADRARDSDRVDSHHRTVCLSWLQLLMNRSVAIFYSFAHSLIGVVAVTSNIDAPRS
ncbi:hypothetical protein GOBAR_AA26392 [Gossypium barbadense]|uniref:Uncharacterized protein n=1 Tax=Gossypium barbadense TaxID=3634 RepID=A0A2P5WT84_GOSBA|nr:hypothetical protein GOBAR_AA26392 [Gossypium barbadense]